jgi:hypothetical protein
MRAGTQRDKQEQEKSKRGKPAESVLQVCALTLLVYAPLMHAASVCVLNSRY